MQTYVMTKAFCVAVLKLWAYLNVIEIRDLFFFLFSSLGESSLMNSTTLLLFLHNSYVCVAYPSGDLGFPGLCIDPLWLKAHCFTLHCSPTHSAMQSGYYSIGTSSFKTFCLCCCFGMWCEKEKIDLLLLICCSSCNYCHYFSSKARLIRGPDMILQEVRGECIASGVPVILAFWRGTFEYRKTV